MTTLSAGLEDGWIRSVYTRSTSGPRHAHFVMDVPELPGWYAVLRLDDVEGAQVITEFRIFSRAHTTWLAKKWTSETLGLEPTGEQPTKALNSTLLRRVPLARLVRRAFNHVPLMYRENVMADWLDTDRRRPGRQGRSDLSYATWARAYAELFESGERKPTTRLAEEQHLSPSQVGTIIGEARRRGLLTRASPGMAGSELTDIARQMLSESKESEVI